MNLYCTKLYRTQAAVWDVSDSQVCFWFAGMPHDYRYWMHKDRLPSNIADLVQLDKIFHVKANIGGMVSGHEPVFEDWEEE